LGSQAEWGETESPLGKPKKEWCQLNFLGPPDSLDVDMSSTIYLITIGEVLLVFAVTDKKL
jgi:hypothetical protein